MDGGSLDPFDDLAEFLGEAAPDRVHALAFAVHERPGDALEIDGEAPVVKCGERRRHGLPYSAAMEFFGGEVLGAERSRGLPVARELGGVEIIDGDHACGEIANLGERLSFLSGDDALLLGLGDPIVVVVRGARRPCEWRVRASCRPPRRR